MVKVIVKAGKTFQGVQHFEDTRYDVSHEWALYLVREGTAELVPDPLSDPNSFKGAKGPHDT